MGCQMGGEQTNSVKHGLNNTETIHKWTQNIQHFQKEYQAAKLGKTVNCGGNFTANECRYYFAYRLAANLDSLKQVAHLDKELQIKAQQNSFGKIKIYQILNENLGINFKMEVDSLTHYYMTGIEQEKSKSIGMKIR